MNTNRWLIWALRSNHEYYTSGHKFGERLEIGWADNDLYYENMRVEHQFFSNACIQGAIFIGSKFVSCEFFCTETEYSSFYGCSFTKCVFWENDFTGAIIKDTTFTNCVFKNASFDRAFLTNVKFVNCTFENCTGAEEIQN